MPSIGLSTADPSVKRQWMRPSESTAKTPTPPLRSVQFTSSPESKRERPVKRLPSALYLIRQASTNWFLSTRSKQTKTSFGIPSDTQTNKLTNKQRNKMHGRIPRHGRVLESLAIKWSGSIPRPQHKSFPFSLSWALVLEDGPRADRIIESTPHDSKILSHSQPGMLWMLLIALYRGLSSLSAASTAGAFWSYLPRFTSSKSCEASPHWFWQRRVNSAKASCSAASLSISKIFFRLASESLLEGAMLGGKGDTALALDKREWALKSEDERPWCANGAPMMRHWCVNDAPMMRQWATILK